MENQGTIGEGKGLCVYTYLRECKRGCACNMRCNRIPMHVTSPVDTVDCLMDDTC